MLLGFPPNRRVGKARRFGPMSQILFLGLPIVLLSQVPLAQLERRLDYKQVF